MVDNLLALNSELSVRTTAEELSESISVDRELKRKPKKVHRRTFVGPGDAPQRADRTQIRSLKRTRAR